MKQVIGICAIIGLSASALLAQSTTVVPQQYLNNNAPSGLNSTLRDAPNMRSYQCVYAASELGDIAPGTDITGIAWRQYSGGANPWPGVDANWSDYDVYLSTSNNPPGSLSTTFADNEGADRVLCHSSAMTIPAGSFPPGSNPPADRFGYVIPFSTPFTYNGGDLCVTVRHTGNDTGTNAFVGNAADYGSGVHAGYATSYDATTMSFTYSGPIVAQLTYAESQGVNLGLDGQCPGNLFVGWFGATPNTDMGLLFAYNEGGFTIPGGPCAGTELGLGRGGLRLVTVINSGNGGGVVEGRVAACGCGGFLQLVVIDGNPCTTSNVAQIPG